MNHEVYLRARLADEEKRLEPGMKAAIAWALEEIATWRGMWVVANKRANAAQYHRAAVSFDEPPMPFWTLGDKRTGRSAMLTNEKIREILATEAKATPGPWFEQYEYDGGRTVCQMRSTDTTMSVNRAAHVEGAPYEKTKENAELIALSRNHIRELCEEVLRLREEVAELMRERIAREDEKGGAECADSK